MEDDKLLVFLKSISSLSSGGIGVERGIAKPP